MSNEIILSGKAANLPAPTLATLRELAQSPQQYYAAITPLKADEPLREDTPTLSIIKRSLGADGAMLAVSVALMELRAWFNVKLNLNDDQIAMISEMIIEEHWDMSLNEIKGVFRKKMRNAKLFNKLDGSDIMQWLDDYKAESMAAVQSMRDNEHKDVLPSQGAVTFQQWLETKTPEERAEITANFDAVNRKYPSDAERRKKEFEFEVYKQKYHDRKRQGSD